MYKERANPYGLYPKTWKEIFFMSATEAQAHGIVDVIAVE
jgi:ATP-dependent protease ClpP protease subunit